MEELVIAQASDETTAKPDEVELSTMPASWDAATVTLAEAPTALERWSKEESGTHQDDDEHHESWPAQSLEGTVEGFAPKTKAGDAAACAAPSSKADRPWRGLCFGFGFRDWLHLKWLHLLRSLRQQDLWSLRCAHLRRQCWKRLLSARSSKRTSTLRPELR